MHVKRKSMSCWDMFSLAPPLATAASVSDILKVSGIWKAKCKQIARDAEWTGMGVEIPTYVCVVDV